jgi:hypothetical protein
MRRFGAFTVGLAAAVLIGACTDGGPGSTTASTTTPAGSDQVQTIPQPPVTGLPLAPESRRVDLAVPKFSDPTTITNPLFPVSSQESVLLLGRVDGQPFRTEVTLLPFTRIIEWEGMLVETLVSQYAAYLDGRLHEVAYDFYAQADDGSVWYFGEDVFNFGDGAIVDTHGTWLAGKDGPAAMIMPGDPQIGDVYRPENIPGLVFEEVTVKTVDQTLDGPFGPIEGGLLIEELHMDGATEGKSFAPGYGEFFTSGGGDVEALALGIPTDAGSGPAPSELVALEAGAAGVLQAALSQDWGVATAAVDEMNAAWAAYAAGEVPERIEPRMSRDLGSLAAAVRARSALRARQAAIDAGQWSLDLLLRHRPATEIDVARFDLWLSQLMLDAAAGDGAAVNGDFFTLDYIRDRILHTMASGDAAQINSQLEDLGGAVGDGDFEAATEVAAGLRETVARLSPGA